MPEINMIEFFSSTYIGTSDGSSSGTGGTTHATTSGRGGKFIHSKINYLKKRRTLHHIKATQYFC